MENMIMCVTGNIHTAREYARKLFNGIIDVYIGRYHGYAQTCMRTDHDVDETEITITKCTIGDLNAID